MKLKELEQKLAVSTVDQEAAKRRQKMEEQIAKLTADLSAPTIGFSKTSQALLDEKQKIESQLKKQAYTRDVAKLKRTLESVDVLFVMDITGSMKDWIKEAKNKVVDIASAIKEKTGNFGHFRVGFVGYRDICDGTDRHVIYPFDDDPKKLADFLGTVRAFGGGNPLADVAGGLNAAQAYDWEAKTRVVFWLCDAPGHGNNINNGLRDDYPSGDPGGLDPEAIVVALRKNDVDMCFIRIDPSTDPMIRLLKRRYDDNTSNRKFLELELGSKVDLFLPNVIETIFKSMTASQLRNITQT